MPQARLTKHEMSRLPIGNQHTECPTLIEWQAVKGAAMQYEVPDWTSKIDKSLSYQENMRLMAQKGTNLEEGGGPTMRQLAHVIK